MARARRVLSRTPVPPPSVAQSVLRLASVTGRTALQDAQEIGAQLVLMARQTLRGTQTASVAIARDVADIAKRAAGGVAGGLNELRQDLTGSRSVSRKPAAKAVARRPTPARRRRGTSRKKAVAS